MFTCVPRSCSALLAAVLILFDSVPVHGHDAAEEMAEAAGNLLAALTPEQRAKAVFPMPSEERLNWHFVPIARKGLPLKEMTPAQHHLAKALLASGLSHRGFAKASTIMSLEDILKDIEQGRGPVRDPELYFVSVFGQPGPAATWAWRVEGHHLSVNFTLVKGTGVSATPSFMGSNPAEVRNGPRQGLRVLSREEDLGRALIALLDEPQRKIAVFSDVALKDIVTGDSRRAKPLQPEGLSAAKMNAGQKKALRQLVEEYARRHRPEVADTDLAKIEQAGFDRITFAWAGSLERGKGHYYRIQGPTFLMEYDNTQNEANHIHAVWRDFEGDFGEDLLRQHYRESPHPQAPGTP